MPSLGEQLFQAYQQQATGTLSIVARGRETDLLLNNGELVGARIRTDYQSPAQTLLTQGIISTHQLDAWWARGVAGAPDDEALEGLSPGVNCEVLHIISNVQALSRFVEDVRFESRAEEPTTRRLPLAPVLRAAFEAEPHPQDLVYRLIDVELARPWLNAEEQEWLLGFSGFTRPDPYRVGLLELLAHLGAVESIPSLALHAAAPAEADPQVGAETDLAMMSGDHQGDLAANEARLAEAARLAVEEQIVQDELAQAPTEREVEAMQLAPERAQAELLRDMDEALRRAGTNSANDRPTTAEEAALPDDTETIELTAEMAGSGEEVEAPEHSSVSIPAGPVIFGPGATSSARLDDDLWKLVEFDSAQTDATSSSFEQALQRIDASLEEIIGSVPSSDVAVPVEAEVQAIEPPSEEVPVDDFFQNDSWPFNEAELATDPMDPADEARARRQRLLRRAMENMGTLQPPRRPEGAEVVTPITSDPISPAAPPDSTQEKQFAESIEQRFAALQSDKDYFVILGLDKHATKEQVKAAFLSLAKIFHPDRLPASLQVLVPKINAVFESIREAYDNLHDDPKRQEYAQKQAALKKASAPVANAAEEGAAAFKQAEHLFKRKDYLAAELEYDAAFAAERKAVYLAGKGWCWYMDPDRRGDGSKAKQILNEALRLERNCDRALYQLGVITRVEGDIDRAERYFRDALQANPKHLEAGQELRLIEMRRKKGK